MNAIPLLAATGAVSGLALRSAEPMLPAIAQDLAISVTDAGRVITVFALFYGCGQLVHGALGDRFGKLRIMTLMVLASSAALAGCSMAGGLQSLVAWRAVAGIVSSAPFVLALAYIGDAVPMERRQIAVAQFVTGNVIGYTCAPLIAGLVIDAFGWRASFGLLGALYAAAGTMLALTTRGVWGAERTSGRGTNPFASYLEVLRRPKARLFTVFAFIEAFFFFGAFAYVGAMLKARFDLSFTLIGLSLAGFGAGALSFNVLIRSLSGRLDPRRLTLYGGVACGLLFMLVAWLPDWRPVPVCMLGIGFGFYMLHNVLQVRGTEISPGARGVGLGLFGVTWTLGQAVGIGLIGVGIAQVGFGSMIALYGAGFALFAIWMRFNLHRLP